MVCQGASQTRFRALKHENGIAGKATIIVRVIACFQPLQDCQETLNISVDNIGHCVCLMVETSTSWLCQQRSRWETSTFRNCMIAPVEYRQHEFLPASVNPCRVSANLGLNGLGLSGLPEKVLTHEANCSNEQSATPTQTPLLASNGYLREQTSLFPPRVDVQTSTCETPCPQEKRFLIFDQSGNETRLIFSSLCPWMRNLTTAQTKCPVQNPQATPVTSSGAFHILADGQANKLKQAGNRAPLFCEESGENETVDEGSEMREDTEEINALLYSDDDDNFDDEDEDDDEEVSTGHSPLVIGRDCENLEEQEEEDFDEVGSFDRALKRQKALDGGHNKLPLLHATMVGNQDVSYENIQGEGLIRALEDGVGPTVGSKRPRKDKIRDTLRVLEGIIPGVRSKDPLVILDEAIIYLKHLKSDAETMTMEEPDSSNCYGPSN